MQSGLQSRAYNSHNISISICLLTYNQNKFVKDSLESLLSQRHDIFELIISDDKSTDDTFQLLQRYTSSCDFTPNVRLVQPPKNLGILGNMQHAFMHARGELIVMAAGDDISKPQRIATLYKKWLDTKRPAAIFSNFDSIDENSNIIQRDQSGIRIVPWNNRVFPNTPNEWILGATSAYSREFLAETLICDKTIQYEDLFLTAMAKARGHRIVHIDDSLVLYRVHPNALTNNNNPLGDTEERRKRSFSKHETQLRNKATTFKAVAELMKTGKSAPNFRPNALADLISETEFLANWRHLTIKQRMLYLRRILENPSFSRAFFPRLLGESFYNATRSITTRSKPT